MPVLDAQRRRTRTSTVSDYALHWLSQTKLSQSFTAHGAPTAAEPSARDGGTPTSHSVAVLRQQQPVPEEAAPVLRTKSFGCQADAAAISAEVSGLRGWVDTGRGAGVPQPRLPRRRRGRPRAGVHAAPQRSRTNPFAQVHAAADAEADACRGAQGAREVHAGGPSEPGDRVPLLQAPSSSSSGAAGASPVSARVLHPSPEHEEWGSGAEQGGRVSESAAEAAAERWQQQDRYWTPDGWTDSIEVLGQAGPAR